MKRTSTIIGVGKYLPERRQTSLEFEEECNFRKLGVKKNTIKIINGVKYRYIAAEDEHPSDLATKAALAAIEDAGIEPEDIDQILFCSVSQDFIEPATAYVVQENIDATSASCYDLKNACNGFITGLEVANMYIETGKAETVLVVAGEKMSMFVKKDYKTKDEVSDTNATLGFGDAGAAVILQAVEIEEDDEYQGAVSKLASYGRYWDKGVIWGGGSRFPYDPSKYYMKNLDSEMVKESSARAVFYFSDCMRDTGVTVDETAYFVTSQMSKYAVLNFADAMKIPHEKITTQCEFTGNVGSANLGVGLKMAIEKGTVSLHSGQRLVFLGGGNGLSLAYFTLKLI